MISSCKNWVTTRASLTFFFFFCPFAIRLNEFCFTLFEKVLCNHNKINTINEKNNLLPLKNSTVTIFIKAKDDSIKRCARIVSKRRTLFLYMSFISFYLFFNVYILLCCIDLERYAFYVICYCMNVLCK